MPGFKPFHFAKIWGSATVTIAILLLLVMPAKADHMPQGFMTPILALELLPDVAAARLFLFEQSDQAFQEKMILGNRLDFLFMLAYCLFLYFFMRDTHRLIVRMKFYSFLAVLVPLILLTDIVETVTLLIMLSSEPQSISEQMVYSLKVSTWIKWLSLASVLAGSGIQLKNCGRFGFTSRLLAIPVGLLAVAGFFFPEYFFEVFSLSVSIQMLLFFLVALRFRFHGTPAVKP